MGGHFQTDAPHNAESFVSSIADAELRNSHPYRRGDDANSSTLDKSNQAFVQLSKLSIDLVLNIGQVSDQSLGFAFPQMA